MARPLASHIDEKPQGKKCAAIEGILDEGKEIMDEYKYLPALDAGLIPAAAKLLKATLNEEEKTDIALSELAETGVNQQAEAAE